MFFVVWSNNSFNFLLGWIKYIVIVVIVTPHSDTHSGDMCSGAQKSMQSVVAGLTPHSHTHSGH